MNNYKHEINYIVHQITLIEVNMGISKRYIPQEVGWVEFAQEFRTTEEQWTELWNGNLLKT